jgi:hypothetical protein
MKASIDKIKMFVPTFNLTQVDTFGIKSHNKQPLEPISQSPCCFLQNGMPVVGQNIYAHSGGDLPYHLHIEMLKGNPTAWLTFNPNHYKSPEDAWHIINADLKKVHKFEMDFLSARISRCDIAGDDTMNQIAMSYHEPFKYLAKSRYTRDKNEYPHSLLYKTTGWQLSLYDKGMKNSIDKGDKKPVSTKHLRTELRLITPSYVKNHFGFDDFGTLLDLNQNEIQSLYVNTTKKFLNDLNDISKTNPREEVCDVLELMPELMSIRSREVRILSFILQSMGQPSILTLRHNYIESILIYIEGMEFKSKQAKSNFKKKEIETLDRLLLITNQKASQRENKLSESLTLRLNEYQDKFLIA